MPRAIRLLVLDVDGVLTDGRLYYGPRGELLKVFDVRDGHGIVQLQRAGVAVAVISGRRSRMVATRCRELGVRHVFQGVSDKLPVLERLLRRLKITVAECACVGDDLPDLPLMEHAGLSFAVADAVAVVRRRADRITRARGGRGAVREVCELLLRESARVTYRLIAILAFVALLVGVVVLSGGERQGAAPVAVEEAPDPGYSAKKAHLIQTGPDGAPTYTLDAEEVQQQPQAGLIDMSQVVMGFKDSSGDQWTARGNHGQLEQNTGIVKLEGAVHVSGVLPGTEDPAEITTEHASFDTNTQIVDSRDPVTLLMTGRKLDATGLVLNLKERHLQLESSVHGTYHP